MKSEDKKMETKELLFFPDVGVMIAVRDFLNGMFIFALWHYNHYYDWNPPAVLEKWYCVEPFYVNLVLVPLFILLNIVLIGILDDREKRLRRKIREGEKKKE